MIEVIIPFERGDPEHFTQLSFSAYNREHARRGLRKAMQYLHEEYGWAPPLALVIWDEQEEGG